MNDQTEMLIRELANKLGTTVDHLWGVLVRQAPIYGITSVLLFSLFVIVGYLLFKFAYKKSDDDSLLTCDKEFYWFILIVYYAAFFALLVVNAQSIAAAFLNPEYWALHQLISK
jgi:uncharacterized membrane-anchored protein